MNTVIYTQDFEPITVIDLPLWLLDEMERCGGAKLSVGGSSVEPQLCVLEAKVITWADGSQKPIVVTEDEEIALLLKPDWLPGQRATYNYLYDFIKTLAKKLNG